MKRKADKQTSARYRSDRLFQDGGLWFFFTRERTIEGPFRDKIHALNRLDDYIKIESSGLIEYEEELKISHIGG